MSYATAEIEFIDRESGNKTAYCYPVTKVILRNRDNPDEGREFVPDLYGIWSEVKKL